jgi:hypothetical protein
MREVSRFRDRRRRMVRDGGLPAVAHRDGNEEQGTENGERQGTEMGMRKNHVGVECASKLETADGCGL